MSDFIRDLWSEVIVRDRYKESKRDLKTSN